MITIGYKNKFSSILRAIAAIAIGIVMIISTDATVTVVKVISALIFAAGVVSFAYGYFNRKKGIFSLMLVNAVVDIVIGLLLFFFPGAVAEFIVNVIGVLLLLFGIMQLIALLSVMSLLGLNFTSLLLSILAVIVGIVLIFNPFSKMIMGIVTGVSLIVYGVQELMSAWKMDKAKKEYNIKFSVDMDEEEAKDKAINDFSYVKDAEFHKVDE